MLKLTVATVVLLCALPAFARGTYSGTNSSWYSAQYNSMGQWCCDKSDGHSYFGDYVLNDDGTVTLDPEGINRTLPAYMVLKGQNPTGHAVWWFVESGNIHTDYCFAPGAGG